jgi:Kef-type K+ transport system membrane component KefB
MSPVGTLILEIAVIVIAARAFGLLFRLINQPQVIGEMVVGVLLSPSLLGWAAPRVSEILFPASSLNYLNALSSIGILIYMFLVGLALNHDEVKRHGHAAVLTSHVSIVAPFLLGVLLARLLYTRFSDDSVSFMSFALFMGAAMSITAFPVLARILTDRARLETRLGALAIACAAADDITGWCILAYIVVAVRAGTHAIPAWMSVAGTIAFIFAMIYLVKPLARRFYVAYDRRGRLSETAIAMLLLFVLASALITEQLGIHLVFGAFLAGVIMPKENAFVRHIFERIESFTMVLLLPLFFAFTGLRTNVSALKGSELWLCCAGVIVVAIGGKVGGSMLAARFAGLCWRDALGLGILMNTRGLMELVILNIGLDIGLISTKLFSIMVIMTLVTTFMTTPLLEWVCPLKASEAPKSSKDSRSGLTVPASTSVVPSTQTL